jgi:hypothetical protein
MPDTASIVYGAIANQRQIVALYKGYQREMCPHVLGYKDGRRQALFFQFAGGSSTGLSPRGEWRCIPIDRLSSVRVRDGRWFSGPTHTRPQTCVDQIDIEASC